MQTRVHLLKVCFPLHVMKTLIILCLAIGLVFAGTPFPSSIPGTDLVMNDHANFIEDGLVTYTNHGDTEVTVDTQRMNEQDWERKESLYNTGGPWYFVVTEGELTYYYQADIDYDVPYDEETGEEYGTPQQYAYCYSESWHNGVFYDIIVYIDDSTTQEAFDTVKKVNEALLLPEDDGIVVPPTGDQPPIAPPTGDDEPPVQPPNQPLDDDVIIDDSEPVCCSSALILLIVGLLGIYRK